MLLHQFVMAGLVAGATAACCFGQTFQNLFIMGDDAGAQPNGALIQAKDGNFYGTALNGGRWGYGTVFRITPDGTLTTLAAFNGTNGASPYGALVEGSDGNFYGTTLSGWGGWASVFRLALDGQLTIAAWLGIGVGPVGDLLEGPDGKIYGVTQYGGGCDVGTIFRVSTNGNIENLHSFCGTDGSHPSGGLILASDGDFYGVTARGGADGYGTVYRMTTNGSVTAIASFFQGPGNAVWPLGKLLQASNGDFYGAAGGGGDNLQGESW